MTGITGIVDRRTVQKEIVRPVVSIVTIGTGHLAKAKRVTAGPESFTALTGMACKTLFLLGQFIQNRVLRRVHFMATDTSDFFSFMRAADPMNHIAVTVTAQTNGILRSCRRTLGKGNRRGQT